MSTAVSAKISAATLGVREQELQSLREHSQLEPLVIRPIDRSASDREDDPGAAGRRGRPVFYVQIPDFAAGRRPVRLHDAGDTFALAGGMGRMGRMGDVYTHRGCVQMWRRGGQLQLDRHDVAR
jgi:hypothetical protein